MKKIILFIVVTLLFTSCGEESKILDNVSKENKGKNISFSDPKNSLEESINYREANLSDKNSKIDLAKSYLQYGDSYYKEEIFANKALDILNKLKEEFIVEYLKGYAYEIQTKYEKALVQYDKVLTYENLSKEQKIEALNQKGHIFDLKGDLEKANKFYLEAEKLDLENTKTMLNRGRYEARIGNNELAKKYFFKILNNTNNKNLKSEMYYNISTIYQNEGSLDEAIKNAKLGIKENQDYPNNYLSLGVLYIDKGGDDMNKAPENLKKAIKLYPKLSTAYKNLGIYYYIIDDYDKAIDNFKKQIEVSAKDILLMSDDKLQSRIDGEYDLARSYALKGDAKKSIKYLSKVLDGKYPKLYYLFIGELSNKDGIFKKIINDDYFDIEVKKIMLKYVDNK